MNSHCNATEDSIKNLGILLRTLRENKGMLLIDVGDALGTSDAIVSRWESGDRVPYSMEKLCQLASIFGVSTWDLAEVLFPQFEYLSKYVRIFPSITRSEEEKALRDIYASITNVTLTEEALKELCEFVHKFCNENPSKCMKIICESEKEDEEKKTVISKDDASLGKYIRKIRIAKSLKGKNVAKSIGFSDVSYSNIEHGSRRLVNFTFWFNLAKVLHVSIWQLVNFRFPEFNVLKREVYTIFSNIKNDYEFEAISYILGEITINQLNEDDIKKSCNFVQNFCMINGEMIEKQEDKSSLVRNNADDSIKEKLFDIARQLDEVFTRNLSSSYYHFFINEMKNKRFEAYCHDDGLFLKLNNNGDGKFCSFQINWNKQKFSSLFLKYFLPMGDGGVRQFINIIWA